MGGMVAGIYAALYPSDIHCLSLICPAGECQNPKVAYLGVRRAGCLVQSQDEKKERKFTGYSLDKVLVDLLKFLRTGGQSGLYCPSRFHFILNNLVSHLRLKICDWPNIS